MPYKNHDQKLKRMREWRKEKIGQGYGKALYARRKERYAAEAGLRLAIEEAITIGAKSTLSTVLDRLERALEEFPPVTNTPIHYMPKKDDR